MDRARTSAAPQALSTRSARAADSESKALVGSSSSSTAGLSAMQMASVTRCDCPPCPRAAGRWGRAPGAGFGRRAPGLGAGQQQALATHWVHPATQARGVQAAWGPSCRAVGQGGPNLRPRANRADAWSCTTNLWGKVNQPVRDTAATLHCSRARTDSSVHGWLSTPCSRPSSWMSAGRSPRGRPRCAANCCAARSTALMLAPAPHQTSTGAFERNAAERCSRQGGARGEVAVTAGSAGCGGWAWCRCAPVPQSRTRMACPWAARAPGART